MTTAVRSCLVSENTAAPRSGYDTGRCCLFVACKGRFAAVSFLWGGSRLCRSVVPRTRLGVTFIEYALMGLLVVGVAVVFVQLFANVPLPVLSG